MVQQKNLVVNEVLYTFGKVHTSPHLIEFVKQLARSLG